MVEKGVFQFSKPRTVHILLGLILVFYIINGVYYLQAQSITSDEGSFINYAIRLLKGHPERIRPMVDNSKMPVSVLNLLPRAIEQLLHPGLAKKDFGDSDIYSGRYITLLFSLFTILLVFQWSRELYGPWAGLFSAFLISFCPNMIANAGLVTTDSYSMLLLTLTMYYLWKFCNQPGLKYFIIFSVCIAFSQLVKQSLFHLYVIFPFILCVYYFVYRPVGNRRKFFVYTLWFLFINGLIINLGFYFRETGTQIGNYNFSSNLFLQLQNLLPSWVPIPFPKAFVTGLDLAKYYDQIGGGDYANSSFANVTILGNSSTGGSFWYYYFISLLFKTPVSSLIFILFSLMLTIRRSSYKEFIKNEFFLIIPVVYFLLYMSFLYKTQSGIRQLIFIFPFLYILCGSLISYSKGFYSRLGIGLLSVYMVIGVFRYWKNYYPYTNEFITDKKKAYQYVGSANLEFHQDKFFIDQYLKEHPEVKMISEQPGAGIFLITVNNYLDTWNLHKYDWIRNFKPTGQVAYSSLLITVTSEDLLKNQLNCPDK